ncbi:cation diffusion facilitator family transporter [Accumulibacter sp.]|uniref:cation diffusion facilitator family transporter n=1 Tax=Accumulibacter sp. TaxID=2053492 RepID=UPI0025E9103E|nr:cation diffusion facilitator family transporter [Accumulibacter sp.]MCM8594677.1 cation diffusion facilitator family transporter [Accumulibacter sp.]MCM8625907.1 cation diffusion facilitator family transporter [Accumulibacter sp.]MDS4048823.1 cation diffusion facilitator family transporter [Accumulibacter sp.]
MAPFPDNTLVTPYSLKPYAWLSIAAALTTVALKSVAWLITGSVGLLSDALESLVNLAGAVMALGMLSVAERPADEGHAFGHGKAEYFSSAFEGLLIVLAAAGIAVTAIERLVHPRELEQIGGGLLVSSLASLINLAVGRILLLAGRRHRSITLEADAHHLLTDVWTSGGVILGIAGVALTGWLWLDPVLALLVAMNILWTAWHLLQRSASGLMDGSLPREQHAMLVAILERHRAAGIEYHALRTRESGARRFVTVHVLVPGNWTIDRGHQLVEQIEREIREALPRTSVFTHLEPLEDPASLEDIGLDR